MQCSYFYLAKTNIFLRVFFICLCLFITASCFAQQEKRFVFTHFNTSNGLVSNIVHGIVQDQQGYMWMNTLTGLQRYDGNKFKTFRNKPSDPTTIPGDNIYEMFLDSRNNLWLRTDQKIGIFNTHTFRYEDKKIYGNTDDAPYIMGFIGEDADKDAVIYVFDKGIFKFDVQKDQFMPVSLFKLPAGWGVIHMVMSADKEQMIFGANEGFVVYNFKTGNIDMRGHANDSLPLLQTLSDQKNIVRIFESGKDFIWYSTWPLVSGAPFFQYKNFTTGETKKLSLYNEFPGQGYYEMNGALRQKNGHLWFYGKPFIVEYSEQGKPFRKMLSEYKDEQSIQFDEVFKMYEDNQQNIWITTNNGAYVFNPGAQSFYAYSLVRPDGTGIKEGPAQTACQLTNGNVLVGGWASGLYMYDEKFNPAPLPPSLNKYREPYAVWDIKQAKDGLVWIGLQGGYIIVYDPQKNSASFIDDTTVFHKRTIRQLDEDEYGNMWMGTQSGEVIRWNKKNSENNIHKGYEAIKKKDSAYINKIYADKHGYVWAASVAKGLFKYNAKKGALEDHITTTCPEGHRLWSNIVNDVFRYNDSIILIACGSLDVLNTRTNEIKHITTEDGLPSNTVYSIQKDKNGTLWMGLAHGLCRMNFEKKIFFVYDRRDGITYDNFNPAGVVKMLDERLIYPTDHNIVVFDPSSIAAPAVPPTPIISGFTVGNEPLLIDSITALKKVELNYDNTSFIVEFSTLNYAGQNKIHYHYKLDGIDKEWNESTNLNQATYNYLHPGNYTFRVRAENSNGVPSKETILQITVIPPFYASWWFYALVILAGIAVIYWIDRERINKLLSMQQVRTEIAGNLHEEINTTLNNINLLSEMAKIKADKDINRSKEYIDQISEKSRSMMDAMDDMLWSLDPANDNMERTILRMKEFAEGLQNQYPIDIQMEVDKSVLSVKAGMKVRHELFLIFKEALTLIAGSNMASHCIINIDKENNKLVLKIYDKAAMPDMTHQDVTRCVNDMEKRAAIINASFDILTDHTGTSVILQMNV